MKAKCFNLRGFRDFVRVFVLGLTFILTGQTPANAQQIQVLALPVPPPAPTTPAPPDYTVDAPLTLSYVQIRPSQSSASVEYAKDKSPTIKIDYTGAGVAPPFVQVKISYTVNGISPKDPFELVVPYFNGSYTIGAIPAPPKGGQAPPIADIEPFIQSLMNAVTNQLPAQISPVQPMQVDNVSVTIIPGKLKDEKDLKSEFQPTGNVKGVPTSNPLQILLIQVLP